MPTLDTIPLPILLPESHQVPIPRRPEWKQTSTFPENPLSSENGSFMSIPVQG